MSFIAKLQLQNEEEMSVLRCGFRFNQTIDVTGKPSALPQGGTINLVLVSNTHAGLFDWMISPMQTRNGKITFIRYDTMSKLKTLEFENAHCVEYYETFDQSGDHPMQIQLTLSAHIIKLDDATFKNNWPG
jgi:hypothetical protein